MNITMGATKKLFWTLVFTGICVGAGKGCKPGQSTTHWQRAQPTNPSPKNSASAATSHLSKGKLKVCPEEWIINKMPSIEDTGGKGMQYFIYQGKRRELDEFDLDWVQKNCNLAPQVVY